MASFEERLVDLSRRVDQVEKCLGIEHNGAGGKNDEMKIGIVEMIEEINEMKENLLSKNKIIEQYLGQCSKNGV